MPIDPNFDVDLKALCDKYQVHVVGKVTPVNPDEESFDITASPVGVALPPDAAPAA